MTWNLYIIPLLGALIGWITNIVAIWLIFRPYQPIIIPGFSISVQGLIPKRHYQIAQTIGQVVENELLSIEDLFREFDRAEARERIVMLVIPLIRQRIITKMPAFLPSSVKEMAGNLVAEMIKRETPGLVDRVADQLVGEVKENVSFSRIIEQKIMALDLKGLEKLVRDVASKELKHIELLGALLGFVIGLVQLALLLLFP